MRMKLLKVHGSGNDFFLLDQLESGSRLNEVNLIKLAKTICDRHSGLHGGADGLLVVLPAEHQAALAKMRVINADGSEASMCGNGLRTVARYVAGKAQISDDQGFQIQTMYADLQVKAASELAQNVPAYEVEISPVSFSATDIGMHVGQQSLFNGLIPALSETIKFSAVAVPNPHLVAFVDDKILAGDKLVEIATYLNGHNSFFPGGVNVSFINVKSARQIFVRTFERGVGLTSACGTAMSASSLIFVLQQLKEKGFEKMLEVYNPGGMVKTIVHQRQDGTYWISLIGNATVTANVILDERAALTGDFSEVVWQETGEEGEYQRFITSLKK